jgi:hypothetical protein
MKRHTLTANFIKTICWNNNIIVDWASGTKYLLDGCTKQFGSLYAYTFDSALSSSNGEYVFIYKKLGTKGILLKNGELLREINRPFYCANAYEFPAAIVTIENKTYLIHCPIAYNRLDFEDIETGEIITNIQAREPYDRFYSRLEISADGNYLMSKGWVWHPLDEVVVFNIKDCINKPELLDQAQCYPNVGVEICTASFIDNDSIIIGSSGEIFNEDLIENLPCEHISVWNFKTNQLLKPIKLKGDFGNLFAIDHKRVWDLYGFPKIFDLKTGDILEKNNEVYSGKQRSSIISNTTDYPSIIFNRETKQIAIKTNDKIEVLTSSGH